MRYETILQTVAAKLGFEFLAREGALRLFEFPENEWFMPSNKSNEVFTICCEFEKLMLIERWDNPTWQGTHFIGTKTYFRYNKNLVSEQAATQKN